MNNKNHELVVNYKLNAILILISWGVFLKLKPNIIIYFIPASIVQFLYSHRDYKIEISESEFILHSIFKSKRIVDMSSIKEISIGEVKNKFSSIGAKQNMLIQTDSGEFEFDIYKYDNDEISTIMNKMKEDNKIIINEKKTNRIFS